MAAFADNVGFDSTVVGATERRQASPIAGIARTELSLDKDIGIMVVRFLVPLAPTQQPLSL